MSLDPTPAPRDRCRLRGGPLARRLFLVQLVLIVIVCTALSVTSYVTRLNNIREATADRVLSIAETLAHDPFVTEAVTERKQVLNSDVGRLDFELATSWLSPAVGTRLVVFTPADDDTERRLRDLVA